MRTYESSAKTIEEAISAGLEALGASISDVTVDIIDEGSKGLFGLFGSRQAKVRLTMKETEEDILASLSEDKPAEKKPEKPARKPEAPKAAEARPVEPKPEKSEKPACPEKAEKTEKPVRPEKKAESDTPRPQIGRAHV